MNTKEVEKEQNSKYNIESLIKKNPYYDKEHRVTQADVNMANSYVELIENTRSCTTPKAGDVLRYTNQHGDYYPYAHIENNSNGICNICESPSVPFIGANTVGIRCNTSGGSWGDLEACNLRYIGREDKYFCDWGHWGTCANGAVHFTAQVSVWEYIHPEPLYRDYTTEKWRKLYISRVSEERRKDNGGYLYDSMDGIAFRTENEFQQFLKDYKGEVFKGHWDNQSIVWCYRELQKQVSQQEYDTLALSQTSIYCNDKRSAKIKYDDENKTVIFHFVMSNIYQ